MPADTARRTAADRAALVVAEILAPAVLVAVACVAFALHSSPSTSAGLLWAAVSAAFCAVIPFWFMARGAKQGKWDGHHVREHSKRMLPLGIAIGSVIVGLVVLAAGGAPGQLVSVVVVMFICLATSTVITKWWKISMHAAIAAMVVAMLAGGFSAWWWAGLAGVAAVCWSRVTTRDHTIAQVIAGSALGIALGAGLFHVLAA